MSERQEPYGDSTAAYPAHLSSVIIVDADLSILIHQIEIWRDQARRGEIDPLAQVVITLHDLTVRLAQKA